MRRLTTIAELRGWIDGLVEEALEGRVLKSDQAELRREREVAFALLDELEEGPCG